MKIIFFTLILTFLNYFSFAQCNCEKMIKDGVVARQCPPNIIASDNNLALGISAGKVDLKGYVNLVVRFRNSAKEINSNLIIWLQDGNSVELTFKNGGLAYIGNSEVAQGIFQLSISQIEKLLNSDIKTVSFKLDDGLKRTYEVKSNSNILVQHLKCLKL